MSAHSSDQPPDQRQLWDAIAELSRLLLAEQNPRSMLQRVAVLAASTIEGVDEVGITIATDDRPITDAATGGLIFEVDNFQYDLEEGPCLHALESGEVVEVTDMASEPRWELYCRYAADHGLRSSMSFPLVAAGERIGVANLYSRRTGGFSDDERWAASMFAMQAATALAASHAYDATQRLNDQLQEALSSRSTIEQAKGILMARHGIDADAAFEQLKGMSQDQNRKLRTIAAELVAGIDGGPGTNA